MHHVLILGAGKIGKTIAQLLIHSNDYTVHLADVLSKVDDNALKKHKNFSSVILDLKNENALSEFIKKNSNIQAIISSLPYNLNISVAKIAREFNLHYFDLTEDVETTAAIAKLANDAPTAFIPQCGVAPGFINIVANDLMQYFTTLETVKLRCGALPTNTSNALQYSITWSMEGLINEYGNPCHAIENGQDTTLSPLEGLENIQIDGSNYEAFNTSGGIGSLAQTYAGKMNALNYKSIRYPGHCEKMRFLMKDLKLNQDRNTLKRILENALPITYQDVVIVYVSVNGNKNNQYVRESYVKKYYPYPTDDMTFSAIQMTTASSACCVIDIVLSNPSQYKGWIRQEQFTLNDIFENRFGEYLKQDN